MGASGTAGLPYHSEAHNSPMVFKGWSILIILYCIVWYGMIWYGMVWYGMAWYGIVLYRIVSSIPVCLVILFLVDHSVVCLSDYLFFIFSLFLSYFVFDSTLRNVFSSEDICRAIHITFNTLLCTSSDSYVLFTRNIP
jgi:hypothetical protein